jgi:hypothetical protein
MKSFTTIVYSFLLCIIAQSTNAQATIIPSGSSWKFLTTVLIKEQTGREKFDDATWASGKMQELGYGDGDEKTIVSFVLQINTLYIIEKTFEIESSWVYNL